MSSTFTIACPSARRSSCSKTETARRSRARLAVHPNRTQFSNVVVAPAVVRAAVRVVEGRVVKIIEVRVLDARRARIKLLEIRVAAAVRLVVVIVVDLGDLCRVAAGKARAAQPGGACPAAKETAAAAVAAKQAA